MVRFSDPEAMTVNRAGWFGGGFFFAVVELPLGWQILVENFHSWVAHSSKKGLAARGPELCLFRPVITASFRTPFRPSRRPDPARQTECAKYILWVNFCPAGSTGNPSILSYLRLFSRGCFILIASGLGALFPFLGIPSSAQYCDLWCYLEGWEHGWQKAGQQTCKHIRTFSTLWHKWRMFLWVLNICRVCAFREKHYLNDPFGAYTSGKLPCLNE